MARLIKKDKTHGMKYEIAQDIGLSDKIGKAGWGSLTSAEAGRIGGLLSGKNKKKRKEQKP
jgi:small acid-soluble spore protein F (minor alpha/beta-type SASP)